jgi:hypothetical protein
MKRCAWIYCAFLILLSSCADNRVEVLRAVRSNGAESEILSIFDDARYSIIKDDSTIDDGNVLWSDSALSLVTKPESPIQTAIHTSRYRLIGNRLCWIDESAPIDENRIPGGPNAMKAPAFSDSTCFVITFFKKR